MAIKVGWDSVDHNSIRWDFERTWSSNDLSYAERQTVMLASEASETVDLILNMEHVASFCGDFVLFRNTIRRTSRHVGLKLIAGRSILLQRFIEIFGHYDVEFVEGLTLLPSMAEARDLLAS